MSAGAASSHLSRHAPAQLDDPPPGLPTQPIPFRLETSAGTRNFRDFLARAADLVASHGGSLSGEHGDGQARGQLLTRMFGPTVVRAFAELKALFDPTNRMNPGKVVAPHAVDEDLRLGAAGRALRGLASARRAPSGTQQARRRGRRA
ncbi:FAD-binding oxidoreductase [Goodfellowiella coeruleoviolacea]|uniref:FAD linked oxidases, C-terminal domain n=1 Tax=Goodfellowiella coeruleoviolacea TaxID=334858 RepID=A0AAE3KIR4_9PSEU|nr:FAD linked oxidases, C-terminal domain [Goodfellowiella coeruleoviolacea]